MVRLARRLELASVRILANFFAMLGLARLVITQVRVYRVFVARRFRRRGVKTRIMRMAGVVGRFVVTFYLVVNMHVRESVMKDCVEAVRYWLSRSASVARLRNHYLARIGRMRRKVT